MRLSEVIGHGSTVRLLGRLLAVERLPHALVLEGPAGIGRRCVARALAGAVLCEQPLTVDGRRDACGSCDSCVELAAGLHPDCNELPGEAATAELPVDLIRKELVQPAQESSLRGNGRVFILPAVERLRGPASNALLKVLEEPPPGTSILMTTRSGSGLLPTIASRSQRMRLQALREEELRVILQRGGLDPVSAARRATLGAGSHRGLWETEVQEPPVELLRQLTFEGYDAEVVAELVEQLPQQASDVPPGTTVAGEQRRLLRFWFEILRQSLRADLRGDRSGNAARRVAHVLTLQGDLHRFVQPRLLIEGLGLQT